MLYGCLVEAYTFMKGEPDVLQNYQQQFMQGLQGLKLFGESKEVTDQYRTGMVIRLNNDGRYWKIRSWLRYGGNH